MVLIFVAVHIGSSCGQFKFPDTPATIVVDVNVVVAVLVVLVVVNVIVVVLLVVSDHITFSCGQ